MPIVGYFIYTKGHFFFDDSKLLLKWGQQMTKEFRSYVFELKLDMDVNSPAQMKD